jgi:hypothetical protein
MKQEREAASLRNAGRAVNLEDAVDIVGTCDMMCPEFESLQRYFADDLDPFERVRSVPQAGSALIYSSLPLAHMIVAEWLRYSNALPLVPISHHQKTLGPHQYSEYVYFRRLHALKC